MRFTATDTSTVRTKAGDPSQSHRQDVSSERQFQTPRSKAATAPAKFGNTGLDLEFASGSSCSCPIGEVESDYQATQPRVFQACLNTATDAGVCASHSIEDAPSPITTLGVSSERPERRQTELAATLGDKSVAVLGPDQVSGSHIARQPKGISPHLVQHRSENLVDYYGRVWIEDCLPALHSTFRHLFATPNSESIVTDVIISLAACRLSRKMPWRKPTFNPKGPAMSFRPNSNHEAVSYEHYGNVMQKLATWNPQNFGADPVMGLTLLVMFCYLESSMGNFRNFRLHSDAVRVFLQEHSSAVIRRGPSLLAAWVDIEAQNWWRRAYFSTPAFYQNNHLGTSQLVEAKLANAIHASRSSRASVLLVMCESHRLNTAATVQRWHRYPVRDVAPSRGGRILERNGPAFVDDDDKISIDHFVVQLHSQSKILDAWHASLSSADLPALVDCDSVTTAPGHPSDIIQPLLFSNCAAAMNFAYYVTARVMQCVRPLQVLEQSQIAEPNPADTEVEVWISMLLSIAAGIDWRECVRRNVYRVGFANLLLACSLRSHDLATGVWMQTWLEERLQGNDLEEGNFPLYQILGALRLMNRERSKGWDVISLFQSEDDGGGTGKLSSYQSQDLRALIVYGRSRVTGELCIYERSL